MSLPTITNNSPSAGAISWTAFGIQYNGIAYSVAAGNTSNKFVYWLYNNGSPTTVMSDTLPTLTADDIILFVNKSGIGALVPTATIVDGSLIVSGSILADAIGANQITAAKMAANSVTANAVAANSIVAGSIVSGAVTASKLSIGSVTDDMVINGSFEDGTEGWTVIESSGTADVVTGVASSGANALRLIHNSSTGVNIAVRQTSSMYIPVAGNSKTWYLTCRAGAGATISSGFYFRAFWFKADKVTSASTSLSNIVSSGALSTTWATFEGQVVPPSDAAYMAIAFYQTTPSTTCYVDEVSAMEVTVSAQISDGAITTPKLVANSVTSAKIAANAVTATQIAAGSITADKADIGSLSAGIVSSGKFATSNTVGNATSGQGLIIDSSGLRTYNSSGTNTVNLSASDGSLTAIGAFKTAESGNRVEVVSETNGTNKTGALYVYNGAVGGETPSWLKTTTSESNVTDTTKSGYRYTTAQLNGGITTDTQSPSVNSAGLTLVRGWYRNASNDVRLTSQAVIGADMTYVNGTVTWIAGFPHITATTLSALNSSPWGARLQSSEFAWAGIIYGHVTADTTTANNGDYILSGSTWAKPRNSGTFSGLTDVNGVALVNPGLGVAPTKFLVFEGPVNTLVDPDSRLQTPRLWSIDSATQVQVRYTNASTGAWLGIQTVHFMWEAIL